MGSYPPRVRRDRCVSLRGNSIHARLAPSLAKGGRGGSARPNGLGLGKRWDESYLPIILYEVSRNAHLGSVLLAQLLITALRDEQPAFLSCLAFGRTLSHGVDLTGRSSADLFACFSTFTDRKRPHTTLPQKHAKQVCECA